MANGRFESRFSVSTRLALFCILILVETQVSVDTLKVPSMCEDIKARFCKSMPFNFNTRAPKYICDLHKNAGSHYVELFEPLMKSSCSPHLKPFLCQLFLTICHVPVGDVLPSRYMCENGKGRCEGEMRRLGLSWPNVLACEKFPLSSPSYSSSRKDAWLRWLMEPAKRRRIKNQMSINARRLSSYSVLVTVRTGGTWTVPKLFMRRENEHQWEHHPDILRQSNVHLWYAVLGNISGGTFFKITAKINKRKRQVATYLAMPTMPLLPPTNVSVTAYKNGTLEVAWQPSLSNVEGHIVQVIATRGAGFPKTYERHVPKGDSNITYSRMTAVIVTVLGEDTFQVSVLSYDLDSTSSSAVVKLFSGAARLNITSFSKQQDCSQRMLECAGKAASMVALYNTDKPRGHCRSAKYFADCLNEAAESSTDLASVVDRVKFGFSKVVEDCDYPGFDISPTITKTPRVITNHTRGTVSYTCGATGIPQPFVRWGVWDFYKDLHSHSNVPQLKYIPNYGLKSPYRPNQDPYSVPINSLSSFLSSLEAPDSLFCVASSRYGSQTAMLPLGYPVIMIHPKLAVAEGSTMMLPCTARGNPRPSIVWLKDGRPLDHSDVGITVLTEDGPDVDVGVAVTSVLQISNWHVAKQGRSSEVKQGRPSDIKQRRPSGLECVAENQHGVASSHRLMVDMK